MYLVLHCEICVLRATRRRESTHLIANNDERKRGAFPYVRVLEKLGSPQRQVLETRPIVHRVGQQANVRASVERRSEGLESLLSGGVPYLQRVRLAVDLDVLVQELHSDGVKAVLVEVIRHESVH